MPNDEELHAILNHYIDHYKLETTTDDVRRVVPMDNWTGAEIKTLCRLSHILNGDVEKAKKYIVPIYEAKKDEIERQRSRAKEFATPATARKDFIKSVPKAKGRALMESGKPKAKVAKVTNLKDKQKQDTASESVPETPDKPKDPVVN